MEDDDVNLIASDNSPTRDMSLKMSYLSCNNCHDDDTCYTDRLSPCTDDDVSCIESCVDFNEEACRAPSLQDLYRYHVFFSHSADDIDWVRQMIERLHAPPLGFKCCYLCDKFNRRLSIVQNLSCYLMLSERVVLVMTKQYITDTWPYFHAMMKSMTSTSLHQQRMLVVILEDCGIPAELEQNGFLDARDSDFFQMFTTILNSDRLPRSSQSVNSDLSASLSSRDTVVPDHANGHILASIDVNMQGLWQPHLTVRHVDKVIPTALRWHSINMCQDEYTELIRRITHVHRATSRLPWVMSIQPVLVLLSVFGLWVVVFVLVSIIPVNDVAGDILPVRLVVFVVPLLLLSLLYTVRWKRRRIKRKISREMLHLCVHLNSTLYLEDRPLVLTAAHCRGRRFIFHFVYFNIPDCANDVDLLISNCLADDTGKLIQMTQFYTNDTNYLSQVSLAERLAVMMAAAFTWKLTNHMLPHSPQQRHTDKILCLCQFTEECVSSYVHALSKDDVTGLVELFSVNLFRTITSKDIRGIFENLISV